MKDLRLSMPPSALVPSAERLFRDARILLIADDPVLSDGLTQELRAHGCAVGITNLDGRGLDRLDFLDPHVILLDAPGKDEPRVLSRIQSHVRFKWAAVPAEFRWSIIWPPFVDRPDMVALGKIVEPFTALDRTVRTQAEKGTAFTVPLERVGIARSLRAMAGATPDILQLEFKDETQAGRIEISGDLVVGASLWAKADQEARIEGIEALGAALRLKNARGQVRRRTFAQVMNVMAPIGEALNAAQLELLGPVAAMTRETRRDEAAKLIEASKAAESKEITLRVETPESRIKESVPPTADTAITYDVSGEDTDAGDEWSDPKTTIDGPVFAETVIDKVDLPSDDETTQKFALDEAARRVERHIARKKAGFELEMDDTETRRDIPSVRPEKKRTTDPGVAPPSDHSELSPLRPVGVTPSGRPTRGFSSNPPPPSSHPPRMSSIPPPPPAPNSGLVRMLADSKPPRGSKPPRRSTPPPPRSSAPPRASAPPMPPRSSAPPRASSPSHAPRSSAPPPTPADADSTVKRKAFDATPMPEPLQPPPPVETPPPAAPPWADAAGAHPAVDGESSKRGMALAIGGMLIAAMAIGGFAYFYPSLTEASTGDGTMPTEPLEPIASPTRVIDPVEPPVETETGTEAEAVTDGEAETEAEAGAVAESEAEAEAEAEAVAETEAETESEAEAEAELELPNAPAVFTPDQISGGRDRARADAWLEQAEDARVAQRGRLLHAAVLADEANPHAAEALARHFLDASQLDAAEAWARESVRLRRRRARYRVLLGDVLRAQGKNADARESYERALELDPDDRDAAQRLR